MKNYNEVLQKTISYSILKEKESIIKSKKSNDSFKVPEMINSNLKNNLRHYQEEAFENFIFLNNPNNSDITEDILNQFNSKNNHHLFHMATGAGKTMMMAATIIYLYSLGYKRFIFTTNQTNLISKTKLNLLPTLKSSKCEFKDKFIEVEGKKIQIKEVDNFTKYGNDVEILFITIHNLHNKINEVKENSINLNDIKNQDIIILADEAHHFQSNSKSTTIKKDNKSWEESINKLLNINSKNKLLDFTATMDLSNNDILEKYKSKLIYDYTLKRFREDGYSKEISLIQNNNKDNRILQAILINQFRYEIGLNNSVKVVPKILFKSSGTIEELKEEENKVLQLISNFSLLKLKELLNNSTLSYMKKISKYLDTDKKKEEYISLIKKQFTSSSSLIIHSKDKDKETKLQIANNLDKNDNIRMIFAIDMLNEGWDVLSLFDIVKIDEIEKKTIKKSTTSEIQLIGRGARIFPYTYKNELNQELDRFKRKFDNNINDNLRLLEDMNFYSANDNDYINNVKKELIEIGLKDGNEKDKKVVKVKPTNELNNFAKSLLNKFVYTNKLEEKYNNDSLLSDYDINIQITKDYYVKEENIVSNISNKDIVDIIQTKNIKEFIEKFDNEFVLNYVLNSISYFNMNNIISKYKIKSKKELVEDIINLKDRISITIKNKDIELLSFEDKVSIFNEILLELEKQLERKRTIKIGSKSFKNKFKIVDTFKEYTKNEDNVKGFDEELNYKTIAGNNTKKDFKITNKSLYYYDNISWDSGLELELYELFDKSLDSENYLVIRNEVGFKMFNPFTQTNNKSINKYSIEDKNIFELNGEGFEPDFIVLKRGNNNQFFQYFIEVKGKDKVDTKINKWKEFLLEKINSNEDVIIENNIEYKIYGIPFFTEENIKNNSVKQTYIQQLK